MHADLSLQDTFKEWRGTPKSYAIGFIVSLALTAASFSLAVTKPLPTPLLIYLFVALALMQAVCQLLFFLHAGQEAKPRWETLVFGFMVLVLLIIAGGSLWIMSDLNDRVMSDMMQEMAHD